MNEIKNIFSIKVNFVGNKTYLVYSVAKREKINYAQMDLFQSTAAREYFLPFECTKTMTINKISFDISGMTSVSEYLKARIEQRRYFEIITQLQEILSFCDTQCLSLDDLVCSPRYMYIHNTTGRLLMAYLPLMNQHYICDSIPECLIKMQKYVENIVITDPNYMNRYDQYLQQLKSMQDRKTRKIPFSSDSLQHFLFENDITTITDTRGGTIGRFRSTDQGPVRKQEYPIGDQLEPEQPTRAADRGTPHYEARTPSSSVIENERGGTVLKRRSAPSAPQRETTPMVYLSDSQGGVHPILRSPFHIGRAPNNDLVIPMDTVSAAHADIIIKNDSYYLYDHSSNGTYVNNDDRVAKGVKLNNGDKVIFDEYRYVFHCPEPEPEPNVPMMQSETTGATMLVSKQRKTERPIAYLQRMSDQTMIPIYRYPFTDVSIPGVTIYSKETPGKTTLYIENRSASVYLQGMTVGQGMSFEIFSGCDLHINGEPLRFFVEN